MKLKTEQEIVDIAERKNYESFIEDERFIAGYTQAQQDLLASASESAESFIKRRDLGSLDVHKAYANGVKASFIHARLSHAKKMQEKDEEIRDHLMKTKAVIEYCEPHMDQMWASRVVGILLGCGFRDAKDNLKSFYEYCEERGI